ncbi:ethanolamine ammonia-lyase reactivating factor EutA [Tumebacillus permanentifrigoris]|uniref:Ethanolamine utilization protein EutA n=1 Tax=Tumebacillus permanentifrigoris TaxID=378543 RepID=A0A316D652_9BACL|nr:ethanolamine ammonia-lyase reactivating factor EutA [Tumebacillus permanentifrigoris]PWK09663.1 ethanolamine utilization protein EutA [Tumebacillus permanentifrigoris]
MDEIISVGLDIGSSTTKLVISRLYLENVARFGGMPRVQVVQRTVFHQSRMFQTPLRTPDEVDIPAIQELLAAEYAVAGIVPTDVGSGAVIITGETATRTNAKAVVASLAERAGAFVVATAGPDLEGILAGRGARAAQWSEDTRRTVVNVDIGGGTANLAVFTNGVVVGTCTLHIGGKMLIWDETTQRVTRIAEPFQRYLDRLGLPVPLGTELTDALLHELTAPVRDTLIRCIRKQMNDTDRLLLLGHEPNWPDDVQDVMLSGGVPASLEEQVLAFTDFGRPLAEALVTAPELLAKNVRVAENAGRATVIGAGVQSIEVSGATVYLTPEELPLKNIPVLPCSLAGFTLEESEEQLLTYLESVVSNALLPAPWALYVSDLPARMSFAKITRLAGALASLSGWEVIAMEEDLGLVLGQSIAALRTGQTLICLDQVELGHGDYIDVGAPLESGVVPLVVKTLVFPSETQREERGVLR